MEIRVKQLAWLYFLFSLGNINVKGDETQYMKKDVIVLVLVVIVSSIVGASMATYVTNKRDASIWNNGKCTHGYEWRYVSEDTYRDNTNYTYDAEDGCAYRFSKKR